MTDMTNWADVPANEIPGDVWNAALIEAERS